MEKKWKKIKQLWAAETPKIWKWIRNTATVIGAISAAILTAETAAGIDLTDTVEKKLLAYGIALGAGVAAYAQLHQKNQNEEDKN